MENKSKKKYLIGALAVLLVAVCVGGTIAWLTASDSVVNTFTVGEITPPTDEDNDEDNTPDDEIPDNPPETPDDNETPKLEGNIYEIFAKDPTIIPGGSVTKTPYIGVGDGGEDAYVFAYVKNDMMSTSADKPADYACFTLGKGWKPISATMTNDGKYIDGLFVWCGTDGTSPTPLASKEEGQGNNWTGALFQTVDVPKGAEASDFVETPTMTVYCYLYANVNKASYAEAEVAAKAWVTDAWPESKGTAGAVATTPEP